MNSKPNPKNQFLLTLLLGLVSCFSGCASFPMLGNRAVPTDNQAPKGTYRVELSGPFAKSVFYTGEIDGPVTVQTALERSGVLKKHRSIDVMILRVVEETGKGLKMPIRFDPGEKAVVPEQDYAVLPNDRIVVEPTTNSMVDKIFDSVTGK